MGVFTVGRQVALEILMPGWWLSGASIDLDFINGRYYDSSNANTVSLPTDFLSCSRASTGYARNSSGTWISFASNQLRITDLGLLVENAATNNLINSNAPATQTTASLATGDYTLWVEGSGSALASAGSATITGAASATQNNPDTFTVTVAGTVTVTVTGSLTKFQLELGTFPSSFILTTGTAATRAQDLARAIGNLDTLLLTLPRTVVANVIGNWSSPVAQYAIERDFGASGQDLVLQNIQNTQISSIQSSVTLSSNFPISTYTGGVKVGVALAAGARSISGDGAAATTDTNAQTQTTGDIRLGLYFGYNRRFTFWNSKLADATLQALTAP